MTHETEAQIRLRRAKDAVAIYQDAEASARQAHFQATEATKRARERYEELFLAEQQAEVKRRKEAYNHATN